MDWDDGNYSSWLGPFDSGVTATAKYTWSKQGTYEIRVKAMDVSGRESSGLIHCLSQFQETGF